MRDVLSFFGVLAIALGLVFFGFTLGPVNCPAQAPGSANACAGYFVLWRSAAIISVVAGIALIVIDRGIVRRRGSEFARAL